MSRYALPITLALALLALAVFQSNRQQPPGTPEATVLAFFDAAERGDVNACVRLLSTDLGRALERSSEATASLRGELQRAAEGLTGVAIIRSERSPSGLVSLDVELVFTDRNERQRMVLRPESGGWLIESMHAARRVEPPIPYGTSVFETIQEQ